MRDILNISLKQKVLIASAMALCAGLMGVLASSSAFAATTNSLYSYDLTGTSGTISNGAAANTSVDLNLEGDWTATGSDGVYFTGDITGNDGAGPGTISVGAGRPGGGANTIDEAASRAVGVAVKFKFQAPANNEPCFDGNDSRNVTQIGRFGEQSQIKIQLTNCHNANWAVFPACRFAGDNSTTADAPFVGTKQQLVNGQTYIVRCYKAPDPETGLATATMDVTQINLAYGNRTTTETFQITPTGRMHNTAWLSVANKYQLPAEGQNTDQFVGHVSKVAYCAANGTAGVKTCLETEVPDPSVTTPVVRQWAVNQSVESDLAPGWTGLYGSSPYVSVARSTEQAYSGSASVKVTGLTGANNLKSGFGDSDPDMVTNTTTGEVYTGSVWVKPGAVGEKLNLRIKEWNGSTLVGDERVELTPANTDWQQITNVYTAVGNGNRLAMSVYGQDVDAGETFYADDMSLVSTLIDHQWVTNTGVDANNTGWTDAFASSPYVSFAQSTEEAHSGAGSVKVTATTGASNLSSGFSNNGTFVTAKVEAGKLYTSSVWVKPSFSGQQIVLRLLEQQWNGTTTVVYNEAKHVLTTSGTGWQQITVPLATSEDGTNLKFIVHGKAFSAGEHFYADDFSLTSLE